MKLKLSTIRGLAAKTVATLGALLLLALTSPAFASAPSSGGSGMPWEGPLTMILQSIQGPVARAGIFLAIIVTGLMMAFGEHGQGFKKVLGIAFGGAIVIGTTSFVSTLFGAGF